MSVRSILRNIIWLSFAQIIGYIFLFLYGVYAAKYLGAEGFGILSFAIAFGSIASIFIDFGFGTLSVREIARTKEEAQKYVSNILMLKIFLTFLITSCIFVSFSALRYPHLLVLLLVSTGIFLNNISFTFFNIFQAYEDLKYQAIGRILSSFILFLTVPLSIHFGFGLLGFAILYFSAQFIVFLYALGVSIWKFVKPKLEFNIHFIRTMLKEAWPFGIAGVLASICFWTDSVMLAFFQGNVAVGLYNAAYRIIMVLLVLPGIFNTVLFPVMSRLYQHTNHKIAIQYFLKGMLLLGLPIGVGITVLANKIMLFLFGTEYLPAATALKLLVWSGTFIFLNQAYSAFFGSKNVQIIIAKIIGTGAIINVVLNLFLIPKYSYVGASITTIATEVLIFVMYAVIAERYGYGLTKKEIIWAVKTTFAAFIMGLFLYFFINQNLLFLVLCSIIIYFGLLLLIKGIDKMDLALLKKVF
ncbi:MAG: flippase [Candidatus Nanoarchaeia archaeon]